MGQINNFVVSTIGIMWEFTVHEEPIEVKFPSSGKCANARSGHKLSTSWTAKFTVSDPC